MIFRCANRNRKENNMDIFNEWNKAYDDMTPEDQKACDTMTTWEWQHYMLDHPDHFRISEDPEIINILRKALPEKDPENYLGEKAGEAMSKWAENKADYLKFLSNLPEYIHKYITEQTNEKGWNI